MPEIPIGKITNYFDRISVAVIEVTDDELRVGDRIHIKGSITDIEQVAESLQIEHQSVESVKVGESAGLKVVDRVKKNDIVYKVIE